MMRLAFVVLAGLFLAGCASHRAGVLTPVAPDLRNPAASTVTMIVATSRRPSGDPATLFTGERSPYLSLTDIQVSIPPGRKVGTVAWPRGKQADPARDFAVLHANRLTSVSEAKGWLKQNNPNGHVLLFVHGFNNRYEDSVFRFAQIVNDSGAKVVPVLFTWPSRASVFDYNYDKESTNFSRTALEVTLKALTDDPTVSQVTVLAHSMGTWLAIESLRQLAIRNGRIAPKIQNVILASPDLDVDVFSRQWSELGPKKPRFTIFVAQDDRALAVSRIISGGVVRVGQIDPTTEPYKTRLESAGITVIDLTKVRSGDRLNHGRFAQNPEIVELIGQRLVAGQALTDSDISLGDSIGAVVSGTVGTVGKVAGGAVGAPITLLEGKGIPALEQDKELGAVFDYDAEMAR